MRKNIVVTGATGNIGRAVVAGLAEKGRATVALVRDTERSADLSALGVKLARGSFEDRTSLEGAFVEADTVVLVTPANPGAAEQALAAIDAARTVGVRKIVRVSALKASLDGPTDNTRQHGRTEAALKESGLTSVVLRPHLFMQNLLASLPTISGQGQIYFGVGAGKMGMVDTRDVAEAAIVAATTDAHDGAVLELTGPSSIDYHVVAEAVSRGLGRTITYVPVPPGAAADAMRAMGADDWSATVIRDYCVAYARGWGDFTTPDFERLTGRAPRSIDDFVRDVLLPASRAR